MTPAEPMQLRLPDGRHLDVWTAGPADGDVLMYHGGTPGSGLPWGFDLGTIRTPVHIWQGAHDRMVPFAHGQWLTEHVGHACAHLHQEHGHLTLAVDSIPAILDEMLAADPGS